MIGFLINLRVCGIQVGKEMGFLLQYKIIMFINNIEYYDLVVVGNIMSRVNILFLKLVLIFKVLVRVVLVVNCL